ncbi:type II toxin-antitoxin system RelB/DinJ family antitoxin [Fenollaria sporofastidiosus]|uniref:type II toxin-antitoxin system RelB/DinJ family antitoxin n=1 Tax=Fenollaria sporofastidiosus TaxID=2811778 RepID=UPI001C0040C5|nr:type II toxin-antitoxin system RelB/DinJ family antitoxin [Fenollaria sporofastidiosus]
MSKSNLTISMDKNDKEKFINLVDELGLNVSTAINLFVKQSIRENALPLNLKLNNTEKISEDIMNEYDEAFRELSK